MDAVDLDHRFAYHQPPDERTKNAHAHMREQCRVVAAQVAAFVPDGREQSLAITKLEEAMMWANAGIARLGVRTNGVEESSA